MSDQVYKIQELEVISAQQQKEGKYLECLDTIEQILQLKIECYGETSDEYNKSKEKLCELCNLIAMIFLKKERFDVSLEFLKKAEILSEKSQTFKSITLNNLACYYRRQGKLRIALNYLQQSLQIELKQFQTQNISDTHLNLCAVLSQQGKHEEALEHALLSVMYLQESILLSKEENKQQERIAVLAIAYHNMGVELEFLKRYEEAILTYQKAVNFSEKHLGEKHDLVNNLKNVLGLAQDQINEAKLKDEKRKMAHKTQEKLNTGIQK